MVFVWNLQPSSLKQILTKIVSIYTNPLKSFIETFGHREPNILTELRQKTLLMPESKMIISPELGQFLGFMVRLLKPKSILEIGTYTGYSSTCMGLASDQSTHIITLDRNREWTKIAKSFWQKANIDNRVELILGNADISLKNIQQQQKKFDFIFIDADKRQYDLYYEYALEFLNPEGIIILDNMLWGGRVCDDADRHPATPFIKSLLIKIQNDPRVDMTLIPIDDGIIMAKKLS